MDKGDKGMGFSYTLASGGSLRHCSGWRRLGLELTWAALLVYWDGGRGGLEDDVLTSDSQV